MGTNSETKRRVTRASALGNAAESGHKPTAMYGNKFTGFKVKPEDELKGMFV